MTPLFSSGSLVFPGSSYIAFGSSSMAVSTLRETLGSCQRISPATCGLGFEIWYYLEGVDFLCRPGKGLDVGGVDLEEGGQYSLALSSRALDAELLDKKSRLASCPTLTPLISTYCVLVCCVAVCALWD